MARLEQMYADVSGKKVYGRNVSNICFKIHERKEFEKDTEYLLRFVESDTPYAHIKYDSDRGRWMKNTLGTKIWSALPYKYSNSDSTKLCKAEAVREQIYKESA